MKLGRYFRESLARNPQSPKASLFAFLLCGNPSRNHISTISGVFMRYINTERTNIGYFISRFAEIYYFSSQALNNLTNI